MTPAKRYSRQREAIYETVKSTRTHPTAEMVYDDVREKIPTISLGTVYRNLSLLTDEGRLREVVLDDNVKRYDGNLDRHYHCICSECGTIRDVRIETSAIMQDLTQDISNFEIISHRLEFYGLCNNCQ